MKKRFVGVLTLIVFVVSSFNVTSASAAGATIKIEGPKEVYAGETYTYEVTVSSTCIKLRGILVSGGAFTGTTVESPEKTGDANAQLTIKESVAVTVDKDAKPGDSGLITVTAYKTAVNDDNTDYIFNEIKETFTATVAAKPAKKQKTAAEKPDETDKPKELAKPAETPQNDRDVLVNSINSLATGSVLKLPAELASCLPRAAFLALKQNGAVLNVDFGNYTCTIDGANIGELPSDFTQIDLSVSMAKEPSLSAAAGGFDEYQLHFAYSGDLPCRLVYNFPVAEHSPGETLYLYYYYELSDVIEGKRYAVVDERGYVSYDIYHCSSYFITSRLLDNATGALSIAEQNDVPAMIDEAVRTALLSARALEPPAVTLTELVLITLGGIIAASAITAFACRKAWGGRNG